MTTMQVGHADFLSSIRLSLLQLRKPGLEFVAHVYRSVLRRECEMDLSGTDLATLSDRDPWDRISYLFSVLFSEESLRTNADYDGLLEALFGALGYASARRTLAVLLREVYPGLHDFKAAAEHLTMAISLNTRRILLEEETGDVGQELDQALTLKALMRTVGDLAAAVTEMQGGLREVVWGMSDLRGRAATDRRSDLGADSYVAGLLLATLAQLQSGTIK